MKSICIRTNAEWVEDLWSWKNPKDINEGGAFSAARCTPVCHAARAQRQAVFDTHVHDMDLCMGKTCTPPVAWLRWVAKSFRIFL